MAIYQTLATTAFFLFAGLGSSVRAAEVERLAEIKPFKVCGTEYKLEVAKTDRDRARGLMFRHEVGADEGMIFVFAEESPQAFWMKNVPIPLDILFFDTKGQLINALTMPAESPLVQDTFLRQHHSTKPSQFVVELKAGTYDKISADKKQKCRLSPLPKIDKTVER